MQRLLLSCHAAKVYGLVAMILVLWIGGFFDKQAKLVRIYATQGVIETVYERAYLIRLNDGRKVRIQRDVELAKGTTVDLKMSVYVDQSERAVLVGKVQ